MMKNLRNKIMVLFVISCIVLSTVICPISFASGSINNGMTSEQSIYTTTGANVSNSFITSLVDLGINVSTDTLLEILPISYAANTHGRMATDATALVVTNVQNDTVTKDVALMVNDNGSVTSISAETLNSNTRASGSAQFPPKSWDGRYIITGTATYTRPQGDYYRPTKVSFKYTKYETCTVNSISVKYICDGFEYSYPEYTKLGNDDIEWVINKTVSSPAAGTTYQNSSHAYPSNKVIYTGSGSPFVGNFLTFTAKVNGEETSYTVKL